MPRDLEGLEAHELIGLEVQVSKSSNKSVQGIHGRVIDETRNTLKVEQGNGREKVVQKKNTLFKFSIGEKSREIEGNKITFKPEDRTKKLSPGRK
ncbi:MAG TPA: ribonuclease P protein subunit, partial [archaeon]|nr:ribonuclease P protein subunit [archaeon]HLD81014.1 ribonuclease P protein subunit [archaeon]